MKNLHKKTIAKVLVGAMVLGGTLQVNEVVSHASSKQITYNQLEHFIKTNRTSFVLVKYVGMEGVTSVSYNNFEEFKKESVKLKKGYYMAHVGQKSILFHKK